MEEFLKTAKIQSTELKALGVIRVVLGNEAGDLDSVVSAIVYAYHLYKTCSCEDRRAVLPVLNINREDFHLRTEVVYTCNRFRVDCKNFIFIDEINLQDLHVAKNLELILIDHNILAQHQLGLESAIVEIIDHHKDATNFSAGYKKIIELVGSCATLITERLLSTQSPALNTQVAGLLTATILLDTINLEPEAGRTTVKDKKIVSTLKAHCEQGLSTTELYQSVTQAKFDISSLSTTDLLRKDYKIVPQGRKPLRICISSISLPLRDFFLRENAGDDVASFCLNMRLDVLILMPIYFEVKSNIPRRQIGVCGTCVDAIKEVAEYLVNALELELATTDAGQPADWKAYDQGNATASRKVVLPLIMKMMSD